MPQEKNVSKRIAEIGPADKAPNKQLGTREEIKQADPQMTRNN